MNDKIHDWENRFEERFKGYIPRGHYYDVLEFINELISDKNS